MKSLCLAAGTAACLSLIQNADCGTFAMAGRAPAKRIIEDPHSGRRWVLAKDPEHPGGPGKLVEEHEGPGNKPAGVEKALPVIRTGDRVLVEERTRVARGLFEAVALSTALQGASFRVRLVVGGRVLCAVATSPGRAMLAGADEVGQ